MLKSGTQGRWREIARELIDEKDPQRFLELSEQLLDALDERAVLGEIQAGGAHGHPTEENPYRLLDNSAWVPDLLTETLKASGTNFGNVQLFDSSARVLRIVAQHGFKREFLNYFEAGC